MAKTMLSKPIQVNLMPELSVAKFSGERAKSEPAGPEIWNF